MLKDRDKRRAAKRNRGSGPAQPEIADALGAPIAPEGPLERPRGKRSATTRRLKEKAPFVAKRELGLRGLPRQLQDLPAGAHELLRRHLERAVSLGGLELLERVALDALPVSNLSLHACLLNLLVLRSGMVQAAGKRR